MGGSFRTEVFRLCNKLQNNVEVNDIRSFIHNLSVLGEGNEKKHGDFAYLARKQNSQFHGFLLVDDNVNSLNLPISIKIENLSCNERLLIEKGYNTIKRFVDLCLEDIARRSPLVAEAINPYFFYKEIKNDPSIKSLISDKELDIAVSSFKNGKVYRYLFNPGIKKIFNDFNVNDFRELNRNIEHEMKRCIIDGASRKLIELDFRLLDQRESDDDDIYSLLILIFALRESLNIACELFYEAICGRELTVLNNNNIIKIENKNSDVVCTKYKVLIQENGSKIKNSNIGSVLLLDCDVSDNEHIHEFGMITEMSCVSSSEMGDTTKYTFVSVDEELIDINKFSEVVITRVKKRQT